MDYLYIPFALVTLFLSSCFINIFRSKLFLKCLIVPDDPALIRPPRRMLFTYIISNWLIMFILWLLTYNVLVIISIPLWAMLLYMWHYFGKTWQAYCYSKGILNTITFILNIGFFILAEFTRIYLKTFII